jgi:hypothetical protein
LHFPLTHQILLLHIFTLPHQSVRLFNFTLAHKISSSRSNHDSSNNDWSSSSSDGKTLFDEMDDKIYLFFQYAFNAFNLEDLANNDEDERTRQFVDMVIGVQDV